MVSSASRIIQRIQAVSQRSREDARQVALEMCARGPKSDAEAQALLDFDVRLDGDDPDWANRFVRVMANYVLARDGADGSLTERNLAWLQDWVDTHGTERSRNLSGLYVRLLHKARQVPAGFGVLVLSQVCDRMVRQGRAGADLVAQVSDILSRGGTEQSPWINRKEAAVLMKTHDQLDGHPNDPAWHFLFARAIGNHLVARAHPNPHSERHALSRKHWIDQGNTRPGRFVGCLALGFDRGLWFERLGRETARASLARRAATRAAGQAGKRKSSRNPVRTAWWRRNASPLPIDTAGQALVDFLDREAPGLVTGLVVAVR